MMTNALNQPVPLRQFLGLDSKSRPGADAKAGDKRVSDRFPDCELINHHGAKRRFRTDLVKGQRVMISFMYTRCEGICGRAMSGLLDVYQQLKRENAPPFRIVSLSVDPKRDTVQDLMDYAAGNGITKLPEWELVVASESDTLAIRKALRAVESDPKKPDDLKSHSGLITFGNDRTDRWNSIPSGVSPIHIAHAFQRITRDGSFSDLIKITGRTASTADKP